MEIFIIVMSFLLIIGGIAGSVLPILPGPPLTWVGLLLLHFSEGVQFSTIFLVITALVAITITILDYFIPIWGTRRFGGTKAGIRGSTIGLIAGLFFFPPFGIIVGPMVGAFIGEMMKERDQKKAFRSAVGSFVGFLAGSGLKLIYGFLGVFWAVRALWF